jgi:hypothetical protein
VVAIDGFRLFQVEQAEFEFTFAISNAATSSCIVNTSQSACGSRFDSFSDQADVPVGDGGRSVRGPGRIRQSWPIQGIRLDVAGRWGAS